jgi:DNA-binding NtrC family response regulator
MQTLLVEVGSPDRTAATPRPRHPSGPPIIGRSPAIVRLLEKAEAVARSDAPVLVAGESGTGKELVARLLHERSARRAGPFVALNCAAFPESLLEAELFGHERGAFTGAVRKRDGRFQAAHGGTLLLDEVAEIPLPAQAKLLRVLEEGTFEPLGTNRSVAVNVRILSATHRDLSDHIARGLFREDLYYRLKVVCLKLPPLRERPDDLRPLVAHFLRRFRGATGGAPLTERAWAALAAYRFPGNVRELEHAIHHAVIIAGGEEIDLAHLPPEIAGAGEDAPGRAAAPIRPLADAARAFERDYLLTALRVAGGRRAQAAGLLGISRKSLWEKLRRHGIAPAARAAG